MSNWADALLKSAEEITEKIDDRKFNAHQHGCPDDVEPNIRDVKMTNVSLDKRKPKEPKNTMFSYSTPIRKNKSGVRGVYPKMFPDGINRWEARIQKEKVLHTLYSGPSFEDAVAARKKAEIDLGGVYLVSSVKKRHAKVLPPGVTAVNVRGKDRYHATYYRDGKCHYLYTGTSLESAIAARKKWEVDSGFTDMNGKRCYKRISPTSRTKSGVVGVSESKDKYWIASACKAGVRYVLYHGKSKKVAIRARLRWEKDGTILKDQSETHKTKILILLKKLKTVTANQIAAKLNTTVSNASFNLRELLKDGYVCRDTEFRMGNKVGRMQYIYRKTDK